MKQYLDLLKDVLENGYDTSDRTGTGTRSVFGRQLRFDLKHGFPLVTTKKVFWKGIVEELLWMISGSTNVKPLQERGVKIWDEWADENGELGPVYGSQWRAWIAEVGPEAHIFIDQLANVIQRIKDKPDCRRLIVSAWNVADIDSMKLPPCHCFFQFKVYGNKLHLQLYQRSADLFLGVPFNIASYALLLSMVAKLTGYQPGEFIHTFGDAHIYNNHQAQVYEQLSRTPYELPKLVIKGEQKAIDDFKYEDFELKFYESHGAIKAEVSV